MTPSKIAGLFGLELLLGDLNVNLLSAIDADVAGPCHDDASDDQPHDIDATVLGPVLEEFLVR